MSRKRRKRGAILSVGHRRQNRSADFPVRSNVEWKVAIELAGATEYSEIAADWKVRAPVDRRIESHSPNAKWVMTKAKKYKRTGYLPNPHLRSPRSLMPGLD